MGVAKTAIAPPPSIPAPRPGGQFSAGNGRADFLADDRATAWRLPPVAKFREKSQRQPPSSARGNRRPRHWAACCRPCQCRPPSPPAAGNFPDGSGEPSHGPSRELSHWKMASNSSHPSRSMRLTGRREKPKFSTAGGGPYLRAAAGRLAIRIVDKARVLARSWPMSEMTETMTAAFVDRRSREPVESPSRERRQFTNSHDDLTPPARIGPSCGSLQGLAPPPLHHLRRGARSGAVAGISQIAVTAGEVEGQAAPGSADIAVARIRAGSQRAAALCRSDRAFFRRMRFAVPASISLWFIRNLRPSESLRQVLGRASAG